VHHNLLLIALLLMVASTYIATRRRDRIIKAAGNGWSPAAALRLRMNVLVLGASLALTALLFMARSEDPGTHARLAAFAAGMSVFHAAIHSIAYQLLLRRDQVRAGGAPQALGFYLDPMRISYLDMAAYWALIFIILDRL
jgi:hypothetical protein